MKSLLFAATVLFSSVGTFAHEGHDHDAPAMVQAPKGGIIKGNETHFFEVVPKGKDLKIYTYSKELKPVDVSALSVSAQTEMPRTKKTAALSLVPKGDHFEATFDAKGSHRYTLVRRRRAQRQTYIHD